MAPRAQITLDSSTLELAPGDVAEVQVVLTNLSGVVDSFVMSVAGLNPDWYEFVGDQVGVFPGQSSQVALRIHPPVDSAALAGNYSFSVIATSVDNPTEQSSADLVLQLSAAGGIALELEPQRVAGRKGLYNIALANSANRPLSLVLSITDPEEALRYIFGMPDVRERTAVDAAAEPMGNDEIILGETVAEGAGALEHDIEVPPGGTIAVPMQVAPIKRVWTGKERIFPFEVRVRPPGVEWEISEARSVQGELAYRPILAFWSGLPLLLRRALPIILGLLFLGVLLYLLLKPPDKPVLPQAAVQATQTAVAQVNVGATLTAIAIAGGSGGAGNGGNGTGGSGGVAGVPAINRFWLEIPTAQPSAEPSDAEAQPNLQWDITSADNVVITPTRRSVLLPGWETSSIVDYNLTAVGAKGSSTDTLSVILVRPPSIDLLSAAPMTITLGESSSLQWGVRGAKVGALDDSPLDLTTGGTGSSGTEAGTQGKLGVTPPETHTYVLCVTNPAGKNCQSVTITVVIPTAVPVIPTDTPTVAPSPTGVPPTSTRVPSRTPIPLTPTRTPTPLPNAPTAPKTSTSTITPTATHTPTVTPTNTSEPSSTRTPVPPSATTTPTDTTTPTASSTATTTRTRTVTRTATPSRTATPTATATPPACQTYVPRGLPGPLYQHSFVTVNQHGLISDVNILNMGMHVNPNVDQFSVYLVSPQQVYQNVMGYYCPQQQRPYTLHLDLDDEAQAQVDPCNPNQFRGTFRPEKPLSVFDNTDAFGRWSLNIDAPIPAVGEDTRGSAGEPASQVQPAPLRLPSDSVGAPLATATPVPSTLDSWTLEICFTNGDKLLLSSDGAQTLIKSTP